MGKQNALFWETDPVINKAVTWVRIFLSREWELVVFIKSTQNEISSLVEHQPSENLQSTGILVFVPPLGSSSGQWVLCKSRSVITSHVLSLLKHPQFPPAALAAEHRETELKTQNNHTPVHHKHWTEEPRLPHFIKILSNVREHLSKIQVALNIELLIIYWRNEVFK